jgi:hypothetical protein
MYNTGMETNTMTLKIGTKYDIDALKCTGWKGDEKLGHEGYNFFDYFDVDGTYKGADDFGIEPTAEVVEQEV